MDKRYQVFVSSTYSDLKEERQRVMQALMEMDCIPAGMELFPAADDEQWEFIKRVIDDCDYYVLIIGGRYGSITREGISYTEKEFGYAKERGLKVLAFIHEKPEEIALGKSDVEPDLRVSLEKFRTEVSTGRLVKFWSTAKELPGLVALSLNKCIKAYPAVGWVRADKVANLDLLEEVNNLRRRNQELEKSAMRHKAIFADIEETEFKYIWNDINKLTPIEISVIDKENKAVFVSSISLRYLFSRLTEMSTHSCKSGNLGWHIADIAKEQHLIELTEDTEISISLENINFIYDDLLMYGFTDTHYTPPQPDLDGSTRSRLFGFLNMGTTDFIYTPKMHRFKYWLAYYKLLPESLEFSALEKKE
jgi:hypothetical protein